MLISEQELDPRVKRTRELLMGAFMQLLEEKRLHNITVQDITDRATVNRATFYAHFDDKYDLMEQVLAFNFRQTLESKLLTTCSYSRENLALLIQAVAEFLSTFNSDCHPSDDKYRPLMEAQIQKLIQSLLFNWFESLWEEADEETSYRTTASVLSWAVFGAGMQWLHGEMSSSVEAYAEEVTDLLLEGKATLRKP